LDHLFRKDPHLGKDYHGEQVKLYAEYDRPHLLSFLRSSSYICLQKALEECQNRSLYPEMVFLLGNQQWIVTVLLCLLEYAADCFIIDQLAAFVTDAAVVD